MTDQWEKAFAEAKRLDAAAREKHREASNIWACDLLKVCRADLDASFTRKPERLPLIGNLLCCLKNQLTDKAALAEVDHLLSLPGVAPSPPRRGWLPNPEVKKIMQERGVTRQRAHQILKERQKKAN